MEPGPLPPLYAQLRSTAPGYAGVLGASWREVLSLRHCLILVTSLPFSRAKIGLPFGALSSRNLCTGLNVNTARNFDILKRPEKEGHEHGADRGWH